ncbi:MAG TPA: DUF6268 family outer membrane beta-barrel protein, partial [Pirellulales bacterium]|nr:DUF6268 family outer membrane beta-barrel protein [Pirellulales bacterium]
GARAQRVIFPTQVDASAPVYTAPPSSPTAPLYSGAPSYGPSYNGVAPVYTAPPAGPGAPVYTAPPSYGTPLAQAQPPANFDPYAGGSPSLAPPAYEGPPPTYNDGFVPTAIRLLQEVRVQNTWIARTNPSNNNSFGIDDLEFYASFGIPFPKNPAPILITPGFNFHFLSGPVSQPGVPNLDLPPDTYDAYLATAWRPQITQKFAADLAVSVGVYSDFSYVDNNSIRVLGRGIGLYAINPQWTVAAGVIYLNRLSVKLLPAGGLIWTPHPDSRYEILFPNPKLAQRITTYGNTDVWGYISGEYGGGQWSITHQPSGQHDVVNYNDIRIMLGVEAFYLKRLRGNFEVGYVFNRQILYLAGPQTVNPPDSVMLRAGLSY